MKSILLLMAMAVSFNASAELSDLKQTGLLSIKSYSTEGLFELSSTSFKISEEVYDEKADEDKVVTRSVTALVDFSGIDEEAVALLLLMKESGAKMRITYNPFETEETENCGGYQHLSVVTKDEDGEKYTTCYVVEPTDVVFY